MDLPSPDAENPVLKLNAKELLEFIDSQNRKEREYFDRLLKWFGGGVALIVAVLGGLLAFFGYQNAGQVRKVGDEIREEAKKQLSAAVSAELTKEKIQDQISKALQKTTEAQFQDAINKAVAVELNTPARQQFVQAATKRQLDVLTAHLQRRENIMKLGDQAVSESAQSGPALRELQRLSNTASDETLKEEATGELAKAASFWGASTYLPESYEITTLNGKPVKERELGECDLLTGLRSAASWKDRARSAKLLHCCIVSKNVAEALIHALKEDNYVDVVIHATRSLRSSPAFLPDFPSQTLPVYDAVQKWWSKTGQNAANVPSVCK